MDISVISPAELAALVNNGRKIDLIDVCTPPEYREAHIAFARSVPLDRLDPAGVMRSLSASAEEPLYIICRSGNRGRQACERFVGAGFPNVVNIDGGMSDCAAAHLPIIRGKKTVSLDRQVRIAIGSFVLIGALLGWLFNTAFFGLSAFMGAGLIFAGITDTCAMATLIRRMPWNQSDQPTSSDSICFSSQSDMN